MKPRFLLFALFALHASGGVYAQYKVVGPDGRVTYTDRPPAAEANKVTPMRAGAPVAASAPAAAGSVEAGLPFELRQLASRFPVTLYSSANCSPCDSARQMLQQRGVPYTERRIVTEEDAAALTRLTAGRTLPSLTVGTQASRGFNADDWGFTLDAAGYPKESRLPRNWQPPPVTPLASREVAPTAAAPAEPAPPPAAPAPAPAPASPPPSGNTLRF